MTDLLILCVIVETFLLLCFCLQLLHKKYDGTLTIDEARDSWTVRITTDPEEVKFKESISLSVDCIDEI